MTPCQLTSRVCEAVNNWGSKTLIKWAGSSNLRATGEVTSEKAEELDIHLFVEYENS